MNEGEEKQNNDVAARDLLHNKSKLQSLRTYQGDVAEAIKSQNESVASITIKEKVRDQKEAPPAPKRNVPVNFMKLVLALLLIAGSVSAGLFVWKMVTREPVPEVHVETAIISFTKISPVSGLTAANIVGELDRASADTNGVTLLKLSDREGQPIEKADSMLKSLGVSAPSILLRNLSGEYAVGSYVAQDKSSSYFIILRARDFGVAFSGLLEWEGSMINDLSFFDTRVQGTTTPQATFTWKDTIIKNKDVRALANVADSGDALLAYTFLDKNTILITNSLSSLPELSSIYASRSMAR